MSFSRKRKDSPPDRLCGQRTCDLCGTSVAYPDGACLPVEEGGKGDYSLNPKTLDALFEAGLQSVIAHRRPGYFACDSCVTRIHKTHGVLPDPIELEMAKRQARYLWDTDIWETRMKPYEFPATPSFPDLSSSFGEQLRDAIRSALESCATERETMASYTNLMARLMHFKLSDPVRTGHALRERHVAVAAEPTFGDVTAPFLDGFAARWLQKDVRPGSRIYCATYDFPDWISEKMAPLLALGISLNAPPAVGEPAADASNISWTCYSNSRGGRCIASFWSR